MKSLTKIWTATNHAFRSLVVATLASLLVAEPIPSFANPNTLNEEEARGVCGKGRWGIFLHSEPEGAPNITLDRFSHHSTDDLCGKNISHDVLMQIHSDLKKVGALAFSSSRSSFQVFAQFTLTKNEEPKFAMATQDTGEKEISMLRQFHEGASALKGYHSISGEVDVILIYSISPAKAMKGKGEKKH